VRKAHEEERDPLGEGEQGGRHASRGELKRKELAGPLASRN